MEREERQNQYLNDVPRELVELLEVVKMQNSKIYEMQEESVRWNQQHAVNLKCLIERLDEMYKTIKELKEKSQKNMSQPQDKPTNLFKHSLTLKTNTNNTLSNTPKNVFDFKSTSFVQKVKTPIEPSTPSKTLATLKQTIFKNIGTQRGEDETQIKANRNRSRINLMIERANGDVKRLEEVMMGIERESDFDGITEDNVRKMVGCIIHILTESNDKQKQFVALQFVWEMIRKYEDMFEGKDGFVMSTQLLSAISLFAKTSAVYDKECPLSQNEIQWVLSFLCGYCK
ncbi:hypothetical protein EIN_275160 [Entamoeba invadens IP1]|uniref:Uncharacterized protein n=1 Tax=Entamoeba invadens IP1 TaxID=370355 RepID=A0A0A1U1L5_ENTIV|nr:hypothetical protein EIN_275160 [Entamoeba invadens IP1]ELP87929.1 hypothetical protein EIN_275160 [Entamoeba invadens IP1]|eukprot:XP_004254700.1 hypothetical protein EIN_275160 [Entamoeba invadens IP1]